MDIYFRIISQVADYCGHNFLKNSCHAEKNHRNDWSTPSELKLWGLLIVGDPTSANPLILIQPQSSQEQDLHSCIHPSTLPRPFCFPTWPSSIINTWLWSFSLLFLLLSLIWLPFLSWEHSTERKTSSPVSRVKLAIGIKGFLIKQILIWYFNILVSSNGHSHQCPRATRHIVIQLTSKLLSC